MKIINLIVCYCLLLIACQKPEVPNAYDITIDSGWVFREGGDSAWLSANIPGNIFTDLIANNLLDSTLDVKRLKQYHSFIENSWEYRTVFDIPAEVIAQDSVFIKLEGMAGNADVYLNGQFLVRSQNMFTTCMIPCKLKLKEYQNTLLIRFNGSSKLQSVKEISRNSSRKAAYFDGTENNPPLPFIGIWKPVKVVAWSEATIKGCYFETVSFSEKEAVVVANVDIESAVAGDYYVSFELNRQLQTEKYKTQVKKGKQSVKFSINIDNPKLWWCNGMGKPDLYESTIRLWSSKKLVSTKSTYFGIRKIELVNQTDSIGYNFYIKLNGKPVFSKGAVFNPLDLYNFSNNEVRYEQIVNNAATANINLLRVWGGGIYESDIFYDLCDKYGIMVWQDFPFSINSFSEQDIAQLNIPGEITENCTRLRNHPSLAVFYCGQYLSANDEFRRDKLSLKKSGNKDSMVFFSSTLPGLIENICKTSVVIDSGMDQTKEAYKMLVRDWRVWNDAAPFLTYFDDPGSFVLEYGMQSFPEYKTLPFDIKENLWNIVPDDASLYQYCQLPWISKNMNGNQLILDYIRMYYNEPVSYKSFVYLSQLVQANALKNAIEAHRIRKPFCMGSVFWNFNDCWPAISWSVTDYYNRLKPAYYTVKKAFKNIVVVPERLNGDIRVWAVNDSVESFFGECNVSLVDFNGRVWFSKNFSVNIPAEQTQILWLVNEANVIRANNANKRMLVITLKKDDRIVDENILYFSEPMYLDLPVPDISYTIKPGQDKLNIFLTSDRLAKNVVLTTDSLEVRFSDNNIDMLPGRTYCITADFSGNMEELNENLKIMSLIDSY